MDFSTIKISQKFRYNHKLYMKIHNIYIDDYSEYNAINLETAEMINLSDGAKVGLVDYQQNIYAYWDDYSCSHCGNEAPAMYNGSYYESRYCPDCGAWMENGEDNEE